MYKLRITGLILSSAFILITTQTITAQGPRVEYFHDPETRMSWATGEIYLQGGSSQAINFTPVISSRGSPYGTDKYRRDVSLDGPVIFIGNGISAYEHDSYQGLDVKDKIIMFCYDFPDSGHVELENKWDFKSRISEAVRRNVAGIILFSYRQEAPFQAIRDTLLVIDKEIPMIAVNRKSAENIFYSAGIDPRSVFKQWKAGVIPPSKKLITRVRINIKGKFDKLESDHFIIRYRKENIPEKDIQNLMDVNNRSVQFTLNLFSELNPEWKKGFTVYFADYDSKLFFTRHWGYGWSTREGAFMVYDNTLHGFGLAVHENTHTLFSSNWGGNSSFMDEGIAKYAEAMATDKHENHNKTIDFLKNNRLYRLEEMLNFNIGQNEKETEIGYPAAGSFIHYVIETYGLNKFFRKWEVAGKWQEIYGLNIGQLEEGWLQWLSQNYDIDKNLIRQHLSRGN